MNVGQRCDALPVCTGDERIETRFFYLYVFVYWREKLEIQVSRWISHSSDGANWITVMDVGKTVVRMRKPARSMRLNEDVLCTTVVLVKL